MANRAQFLLLAWSKLIRVIKHLVRIAQRNPQQVLRSPVLRGIVSAGFWMKIKNLILFIVRGGSYLAAIISVFEFLFSKRDITPEEALKIAQERGIEQWLNEVDDPHDFLMKFVDQMPLKDERDRQIVRDALAHDLAAVKNAKKSATPAQAPVVPTRPPSPASPATDAQVIDASAPLSVRRSERSQVTAASDSNAAVAVEMVLEVESRLRRFYNDYGFRIDKLVNDIRFFAAPGVEAVVSQLFKKKPNLLNQ